MIGWLSLTDEQRKISLAQAERTSGIIPKALEKDWWVTLTLKALFQTPYAELLIFKGGTSLSKCWKLINRFSEDIDIAMSPKLFGKDYQESPGTGYLNRLKRAGCAFTSKELKNALMEQFMAVGVPEGAITIEAGAVAEGMPDKDPQELFIKYTSLYDPNPYLADEVKIEVSVRSKLEPYAAVPVQSLLYEHFPNAAYQEQPFSVQAVEPHKTFLEKAFLLHEQFHRGVSAIIKTERMSRHYHDLARMMDTEVGQRALSDKDLYAAIIRHRSYYNRMKGIDYDLLRTPHINFYPPELMLVGYQEDYKVMLENMIYGDAPDHEELFVLIKQLNQRFRDTIH
jgi:hypothetical protein